MMSVQSEMAARLIELREAFDRTFAEAPLAVATPSEDLLAITVGTDPYAIRLADVGGLYVDRKITWLPGSVAELRGLVGLRGAILPVYDLHMLLGYSRASACRWFVVVTQMAIALAFEQFDRHLHVGGGAIALSGSGRAAGHSQHVREVVHTEHLVRPIVHLPSVLEAIVALADRTAGRRSNHR